MRRMNIKGNLYLHQDGGYASGGFLADTKVAGTVSGGSQPVSYTHLDVYKRQIVKKYN